MASKIYGRSNATLANFIDAGGKTLSTSSSSARVTLPSADVITVIATGQPAFLRLGSVTVVAAATDAGFSVYAPVGVPIDIPCDDGSTHIAGIVASSTGTVVIMARS